MGRPLVSSSPLFFLKAYISTQHLVIHVLSFLSFLKVQWTVSHIVYIFEAFWVHLQFPKSTLPLLKFQSLWLVSLCCFWIWICFWNAKLEVSLPSQISCPSFRLKGAGGWHHLQFCVAAQNFKYSWHAALSQSWTKACLQDEQGWSPWWQWQGHYWILGGMAKMCGTSSWTSLAPSNRYRARHTFQCSHTLIRHHLVCYKKLEKQVLNMSSDAQLKRGMHMLYTT